MEMIREILRYPFLGIPLWSYLAAFGALLAGLILKRVAAIVITRLRRVAGRTKLRFDEIVLDAVNAPLQWACVLAGVWVMWMFLPLPEGASDVTRIINVLLKGISVALVAWAAVRLTDGMCGWWAQVAEKTETRLDDQIVPIVRRSLKVFFVIVGGLLVLQNLGYSITSLLAGLGLGGAALALASKDTVANVFGSLVIFLDQPFQIGDWVEVKNLEGTVEEVGLRTTRVRTFANSVITVPNAMFTTTAVNNWSRMQKRRLKMTVGLTYGTTAAQMEQAVERVRGIIAAEERFDKSFSLVTFDNMGAYSLDIFIYCFTITTNWADYLAVKQDFLLAIMRSMEELGLSFAFPTQSIHVEELPEGSEPPALTRERPL